MTGTIYNARVVGGKLSRVSGNWQLGETGKVTGYIIINDESHCALEAYKTEQDAQKMLAYLKATSGNRGLVFATR